MYCNRRANFFWLLGLVLCLIPFPPCVAAQDATWEDLKKAAEEANQRTEFAKANHLIHAAVQAAEKSYDRYDPRLAVALRELLSMGSVTDNPNDSAAEANRIVRRILEIDEHNLGPDDLQVAADVVAVAAGYPLDDDQNAQRLFARALKIYQQAGVTEGSGLLSLYATLAGRAFSRGDYALSEDYYRKALPLFQSFRYVCDNNVLTNLANTYLLDGKPKEAEQVYLDGVAEAQKDGPAGRCVEFSLQRLADFYLKRGEPDSAEAALKRRFALAQATWGANDLHVIASLDALGDFYRKSKNPEAALRMYQQAIAIVETYGQPEDDNFLGGLLQSLARYYLELGNFGGAGNYYQSAVAAFERSGLNESRSNIAAVWREMAGLYIEQGRQEDAEKLLMDALAYDDEYPPPTNFHALGDLDLLESKIYMPQQRYNDAEWAIRRQMDLREKQYGPEGAPVAELLGRLAVVLEKQGRTDEAQQSRARARAILGAIGQNPPD